MNHSILLVATATRWLGTARIPRALTRAGFEVSLLTPRESIAERSGYLRRIGHLPDDANAAQWTYALAAMVTATEPRLVIACDDLAFRLLAALAQTQPPAMQPGLWLRLSTLIRDSLGDPAHYDVSVDKTGLPAAAAAAGVRVPAWQRLRKLEDSADFVAEHGYPVVLKTPHGFAGQGVAICADAAALAAAWSRFASQPRLDLAPDRPYECLLQAFVAGPAVYHSYAAWKGRLLAGWAGEKLQANPHPVGPGTVARNFHSATTRRELARLIESFGITGLGGAEFILDAVTGEPWLIEISRRVTPASHRGQAFNVDLAAALHAALTGTPNPSRSELDADEEYTYAAFPQEWLRDPESGYLRRLPVDIPWDEPELIEAMLAMRHDR